MIRDYLFFGFVLFALIGTGIALGFTMGADSPESPDSDLSSGAEMHEDAPRVPSPSATETPTPTKTDLPTGPCGTYLREDENGTEYKVTPTQEEC